MGWKYVMLRKGEFLFPIIFPDKLVHADVAKALAPCLPPFKGPVHAVSAGTIQHIEPDGLGGESETLKLKSREDDDHMIIVDYSYLHGIVGAMMPKILSKTD